MFLLDVTILFDKACAAYLIGNSELLSFVKNHERKNLVLAKLCKEIVAYEHKFKNKITYAQRNEIIVTCARLFCDTAKRYQDEQNMSQAAKNLVGKQSAAVEEMKEVFQEKGSQVYTNGQLTEKT